MNDNTKATILDEIMRYGQVRLAERSKKPENAVTIEEIMAFFSKAGIGRDRTRIVVREMVRNGQLTYIRDGSRKYYLLPEGFAPPKTDV